MAMSQLNQRRLQTFKRNRRGYWSFWIFCILFVLSLGAEFLANDKPILVNYDGKMHFPIFKVYPETVFGGDFETEADYTDEFVQELINEKGSMIWPPVRFSHDTVDFNLTGSAPTPPERRHLLGTDDQGRDVVARIIYGFRISVLFGLLLTLFSSVIGVSAGAVQGYFGGWLDLIAQRFIEIWQGLPVLFLLIIMASVIKPSFWNLLLMMTLFSWTALVAVVRAEFLRARNFEYIRAARALGVSDSAIIVRHTLPNAMVATLTFMPFILSGSVTTLTSLDFLGLGLPPGSPSLGELLLQGRNNIHAPWIGLTGFFVIAVMLSLLVFAGEAFRDALDPRKTFSQSVEEDIADEALYPSKSDNSGRTSASMAASDFYDNESSNER